MALARPCHLTTSHLVDEVAPARAVNPRQPQQKPSVTNANRRSNFVLCLQEQPGPIRCGGRGGRRGLVHDHAVSLRVNRRAARVHQRPHRSTPFRPFEHRSGPLDITSPISLQSAPTRTHTIEDELRIRRNLPVPIAAGEVGHHGLDPLASQSRSGHRISGQRCHCHPSP